MTKLTNLCVDILCLLRPCTDIFCTEQYLTLLVFLYKRTRRESGGSLGRVHGGCAKDAGSCSNRWRTMNSITLQLVSVVHSNVNAVDFDEWRPVRHGGRTDRIIHNFKIAAANCGSLERRQRGILLRAAYLPPNACPTTTPRSVKDYVCGRISAGTDHLVEFRNRIARSSGQARGVKSTTAVVTVVKSR